MWKNGGIALFHNIFNVSLTKESNYVFILLKVVLQFQTTPVISNSKGLTETLRDIRTSTYQSWESEENNKLNNHI